MFYIMLGFFSKVLCLLMHRLISTKSSGEISALYDLNCYLFCDIVFYSNLTSPTPKSYMLKHEKIIKLFYSLKEKYKDDPTCANSYLYYIFSIFCKHGYIGETMDILRRKLSHTSNSSKKYSHSFLYSTLHSLGIEHFTFLYTPIPTYLRKALEHQLISWFKPSLNTLHNSDFKSNVLENPSIPPVLKSAVISFKKSHPVILNSYNINSPTFRVPKFLTKEKISHIPFPTSYTLYHDPDRNLTTINLLSLISDYSQKSIFKPFNVQVTHGEADVTNFSFIQNEMSDSYAFGPSSKDDNITYLSVVDLVSRLKSKSILNFLFMPAAPHILLRYHASSVTLPAIARGSLSAMSPLHNSHPYELFQLYNQCRHMSSPLLQSIAKQKLSDLCFNLFHVRPTKVIPFTIKLNEVLSRNKIKTILFSFIKTLPISKDMLLLLQSQTKVTFKGHPKISKLFCNHISWCKKWSVKPFPCQCHSLFSTLGLDPQQLHISTLGHSTSSIFDNVLHSNLNNVCSPNIKSFPEEFFDSFTMYYEHVFKFCDTFKEPIHFLPFLKPSTCFKNKAFNRLIEVLNGFAPQPSFMWKIIQELDSFPQTFSPSPLIPTTAQVLKVKHFLSQKLVLSAPDKNSGIPDLYCPSILWKEMHTSFYSNINFQRQPHLSTECVLQHFKYTFDSKNWHSIGFFNMKGSLPYPYKIRKFKDLSRSRSIISYFHHPLKDIFFKAAVGLMTCLKAVDFFHTNLFNPLQALPTMKFLYIYLRNKFGSETVFNSWAADVKEMYDWLPQNDILKAIRWILSYVSKKSRRNYVAVFFKCTKQSRIGKSYQRDDSINISFEDIFLICAFQISNAYFVLDNVIYLQRLGCPQGGPGSPGFSMTVCLYYEHQFRCSIFDHLAFIFFFRYFDDLRAVVVHRSSSITSKSLAFSLLDQLQHDTYHPSMSLMLEECSQNTFNFLEGKFSVENDSLSCLWTSKNFESLATTGKLKFFTSQDFFSYTGDRKKIIRLATITGRLSTILGYSFTDKDIIQSFGYLLVDLFARNYPKKVYTYLHSTYPH